MHTHSVIIALETSMLMPRPEFVIIALACFVAIAWPAVDAARQDRWLWVAGIILFPPLAGLLWLVVRIKPRRWLPA